MPEAAAVPAAGAPTAAAPPLPASDPSGTGAVVATPSAAAAPAAKPIRPIRYLPGVLPDEGDASVPPPHPTDGPRPRGSDGRFVAAPSTAADGAGEPTLEVAASPAAPAEKFAFADEEFESRSAAEQNFRSLRGQFKPIQSLARTLGGMDRIVPTLTAAADSARGWKAEAERLRAELDARPGGQPAGAKPPDASAAPAPDAVPDADAPDVDWELYAEIRKIANESGEPWKAEQWLINETRKAERARVEALIRDRLAPFTAQQDKQAAASQAETLFTNLAAYTAPDGSPAFPELTDEAAAYEVGKLWSSMGLPAESALTLQGALAAIALYRLAKSYGQGSQAKPATAPAPPPPTVPALPADTVSAASLTDGRPLVASVPGDGPSSPSAEAARILAGLRQANVGTRAVLGFDA